MMRSMTGFARAEAENEAYAAAIEIRSVNHRYLDVRVRVPSGVVSLETQIRDRVVSQVGRGKVDVSVKLRPKGRSAYELEVDHALMKELVDKARSMGEELEVDGRLTLSDLIGFGRAFDVRERDLSAQEEVWQALEPALQRVLYEHGKMRQAEGAELEADLKRRLTELSRLVDAVETASDTSRERKRGELLEKIEELAIPALEPAALASEVARLVDRSDITEEITRFRSHLTLWKEAVAGEGPCGKKLDFIVQEMNREANTMGSKCQDAAITGHVIAIKSEIERVREQVQNIE